MRNRTVQVRRRSTSLWRRSRAKQGTVIPVGTLPVCDAFVDANSWLLVRMLAALVGCRWAKLSQTAVSAYQMKQVSDTQVQFSSL